MQQQIHHTVGISPFIVIPGYHLEEIAVQLDTRPGIKDAAARQDWGWKPAYDLEKMTVHMLENLSALKGAEYKNN